MSNQEKMHDLVRKAYGDIARQQSSGCGASCSCGSDKSYVAPDHPVPDADLGLSCGNPVSFAQLREGDVVLDLGSGAGRDVFLAAQRVGPEGRAIGVDMTPEMLELAVRNAAKFKQSTGLANVEFRKGQIEQLPVKDGEVNVVMSNCVINLSPDKTAVFREAFRALRPGGRLLVSDIVLLRPLPESVRKSEALYAACIAGAIGKAEYLQAIRDAGFAQVEVLVDHLYTSAEACSDPVTSGVGAELEGAAASITVSAVKPGCCCAGGCAG